MTPHLTAEIMGQRRPQSISGIDLALVCLTVCLAGYPGDQAQAKPCGMVDGSKVCLGEIDLRGKLSEQEAVMLDEAATLAIETVASAQFKAALDDVRSKIMAKPDDGWRSAKETLAVYSNDEIISRLKAKLKGLEIDSFGYSRGTFLWWFYGTKAMDGGSEGPIYLNRAALYRATKETLANTIVHEAAHRIGLTHPNKSACEAPYLIGNLVESLISDGYELDCDLS